MSESPKHSYARLDAERQAELERQQQEAREQARLLRIEEIRQEQLRKLAKARNEANQVAEQLLRTVGQLTSGSLARWIDASGVQSIHREIASARASLTNGDERHLQHQRSVLEGLGQRLRTQEKTAVRLEDRLTAVRHQHAALRQRLMTVTKARGERFLTGELIQRVEDLLQNVQRRWEATRSEADLDAVEQSLGQVESEFGATLIRSSRLSEQWDDLQQHLSAAIRQWDATLENESARFIGVSRQHEIAAASNAVRSAVAAVRDETTMKSAQSQLRLLQDDIKKSAAAARASLLAEHLAAEEAALAMLAAEIRNEDESRARKFDRDGFESVLRHLALGEQAQRRGELEELRRSTESIRRIWEQHQRAAARSQELWEQSKRVAEAALTPALDRLMRAMENPRVQRWLGKDLTAHKLRGDELRRRLEAEEFSQVAELAPRLTSDVEQLLESVRALEEGAAELERLRVLFEDSEEQTGGRFDAVGRQNVTTYLEGARVALSRGNGQALTECCRSAEVQWKKHHEAVERELSVWRHEQEAVNALVEQARMELVGLESDEAVVRWMGERLGEVRRNIEQAERALAAGKFGDVRRVLSGLDESARKIIADTAPLEMQAARQAKIRDGMKEAMSKLGFTITAEGQEQPDNPVSALILQAQKTEAGPLPGEVLVTIESNGAVEYDVGGAYKKSESWSERLKRTVRSCDDAEDRILELHAFLKSLGIEMDGLFWNDAPPERPATAQSERIQNITAPALRTRKQ